METNFSFHALNRVTGRLLLGHSELANIIDNQLTLDVGQEVNSNRVHKLFYSHRDNMCFVAVQDVKTGTIVTVLPIDYHNKIAWIVSTESQKQAKCLFLKVENTPAVYESKGDDSEHPDIADTATTETQPSIFKISVRLVDSFGFYRKILNIGSMPAAMYDYSIELLIMDENFISYLAEEIGKKANSALIFPFYTDFVAISLGNRGARVYFPASELIESGTGILTL